MRDLKEDVIYQSQTEPTKKSFSDYLKSGWDIFHKFGLWMTLFILLGCWIGISASKIYYANKMEESIAVGGFLHNSKVYTVNAK